MADLIRYIKDLSIRNKITLIILFVAFTVITSGFIFISFWNLNQYKKQIKSQLYLDTKLVSDYCIVPLVFEDKQQATLALSRLSNIESVEEGYLLDKSGDVFSFYPDSLNLQLTSIPSEKEQIVFRDKHFIISVPVIFEENTIGSLVIKANSNLLKEQNQKLAIILLTVFTCMLIFSFLLASRLQKLITKPIMKLAEMTASISKNHDFTVRLEEYGNDEVGELYKQFNNLLEHLLKKEHERDEAVKEISFLAHVLRKINENVSITDFEDNIIFVNHSFLKTYGYTEEELIGKNISIIRSPDNPPEVVKEILPATLKGGWQGELLNRRKDGTDFPIQLFTTVIYDEQNNPSALVGICTDITERKKVENELIQHRNHLEKLVAERTEKLNSVMEETRDLYENAPCGYHSLDENGIFVRINNTELEWLGYTRDEVVNRLEFKKIIKPENIQQYNKYFAQLKKEGALSNLEFEFIRKDRTSFFGSINATAIYDDNGKFVMSRSTLFDITARKEAEKALSIAKKQAEAANLAKSEFLANMSHEIRTPMNAVLGYTELLSSLVKEPTQVNYIASIKSSGRSLLTLINDILDLSKIEAGKLELEYDYIDSHSFFNEFESIFSLKATEKGIKLIVEVSSGTPAGIYVDEPRLRQIVFNLMGNAIKFTDKGHVKLKAYTGNLQTVSYNKGKTEEFIDLTIEVEDTGTGISKELKKEIFDPFIQARDQKKIGGTGLGLAITRRLTLLMNGSIELKSELGKGSTFIVKIPEVAFKREFAGYEDKILIDPERINFKPATILIVDDIEHNRNLIKDALKNTQLNVVEAEEGFKALKLSKELIPDLIITDIRMPNMDGFEFLDKIKSNKKTKHITVLAYSASVLKTQKERIHNSDFAGLIAKPVSINALFTELMNFIPYTEIPKVEEVSQILPESESDITDCKGLVAVLETNLMEEWNTFQVRQPINEIKSFSDKLVNLGHKHNSGLISEYGQNLKDAAENFNIEAILNLLKQYTLNIEKIKKANLR